MLDKTSSGDIPVDILRRCDLCFKALTNCIYQSIVSGKFPDSLKLASISRVYKSKDTLGKTNHGPVSVLPTSLIKDIGSLVFDQLSRHASKVLRKLLCDFRKTHSVPHALLKLLQPWQKAFDDSNMLAQCSWICQKLITVLLMIYY